jgi:hypothetical protein
MPGQSGISGLALAEIAAGLILAWSGIENVSIQSVVKSFVSGKLPTAGPPVTYATPASSPSDTGGAGNTANTSPVVAPVNASETAWIVALLASIGAPPTTANINSIAGWIEHETSWDSSPPDGALYTDNPLNTTEPGFGATGSVNSVGVKIYPTLTQGLAATVAALENGDYSDILAALRSGKGLTGTYQGLATWSGGGYDSI